MAKASVIVVGSGGGGSVAAWELARTGHEVLILEKGRNLIPGLGGRGPLGSRFGNDEVKAGRWFENQDPVLEPRASRSQEEAAQGVAHSFLGDVNDLPTTVGGGTVHWDAKTPRFWRQDFKGRSLYGPMPDANVADWPLTYDELAPFYDEVERRLGVQGDVGRMPASTLAQAPRSHPFPMPPNPPMYAGTLLAEGAASLGYTAYPFPMAVNSRTYDGRPACNSCGFCSGFGCPINARGGAAVSFLHKALLHGAELRPRSFVYRVDVTRRGRRARGVSYLDAHGRRRKARADIVILAGSAIETEMRDLALREHLGAIQLVGEDMPQKANRVDLHPRLRDVYGFPIPRITYSPHQFEMTASRYYAQKLIEVCQAAPGSISAGLTAVPLVPGGPGRGLEGPNSTAHIMGTARMGHDARRSVTDRFGRLHELENVYIGDGSVFTSSGGFNPTLTIMALSLRMAEHLAGARGGGVTDGRHRP